MAIYQALNPLEELLKKKGIGPEGSKSLKKEELDKLTILLKEEDLSLTTKATLLTALLLLEPNEHEKIWLDLLRESSFSALPVQLQAYFQKIPSGFMSLINKIIEKHDLNEAECLEAMQYLFDAGTPPYLKGSFLEAERLKRESFLENKCFFEYLYNHSERVKVSCPVLIDICDSYDGSNRTLHLSVFVACLLASAGFPVCLHAIDRVAPKEGTTAHAILKEAGKNPFKPLEQIKQDLEDPFIAWGYADQSLFFPELYALKQVRKEMVKRPFLATFEKLLQPLRSENGNFLVTGYTHAHYRTELVNQVASQKSCSAALVVKGVEGSTQMSMSRTTSAMYYDGKKINEIFFHPENYQIEGQENKIDKTISAAVSYQEGIKAIKGEKNYARENILYMALVILDTFSLMDNSTALEHLTTCLDSGKTLLHWDKGAE
jgi:anthranilate phosphoribosyltransferase